MDFEPARPLTKRLRPGHWVALDVVTALVVTPIAGLRVVHAYHRFDPHGRGYRQPSAGELGIALVAVAVLGLAFATRRVWPLPAAGAILAAWLVVVAVDGRLTIALVLGGPFVVLASMGVVYVAATRCRPRPGLAVLGSALVGAGAWWFGSADLRRNGWLPVLFSVCAWAVGYAVGRHRAYAAELREHHAHVVRSEFAEERLRIAREVHDVVAHSLGVVNVQAGYGGFVLDARPEEARAALAAIQATSRDTIHEMRGLLGVLRAGAPADRLPAPGLADLASLVEQTTGAGVRVELVVVGEARELPAGIELSAYRIVQEALTNVVRHAHTRAARVEVAYREGEFAIEVTDRGRGGAIAPGGHGLAGVRERVGLYGGEFSAGPMPERGFRVAAVLPFAGRAR
ncbi:sensor histidine kinase (plasmid) [Embleya sp. NBC_00888]|uniref:sensor histidine kinase n=1 Tax=Embleya sp. NBC_00888 TaxID=2975960 RepID=UPI002F909A18|nr:sensor histidine kinase [Embleya sp. NBC_00888]